MNGPGVGAGRDCGEGGPGAAGEDEGPGVGAREDGEEGPGIREEEGPRVGDDALAFMLDTGTHVIVRALCCKETYSARNYTSSREGNRGG